MLRSCVAQIAAVAIVAATLAPNSARADSGYSPMSFYVAENTKLGTRWVVADGEITADTPIEFDKFAQTVRGRGMWIMLNSPGGSAVGGLELGELIRSHGFNTDVGFTLGFGPGMDFVGTGHCASACAFAFLGGAQRDLQKGSSLGYHDFDVDPDAKLDERTKAESTSWLSRYKLDYLERMGVDKKLLAISAATDPSDIYEPSLEELWELHILTGRTYEGGFETKSDAERRGSDNVGIWILGDVGRRDAVLRVV